MSIHDIIKPPFTINLITEAKLLKYFESAYEDIQTDLVIGNFNDFYHFDSKAIVWKRYSTREELDNILRKHIIKKLDQIEMLPKTRSEIYALLAGVAFKPRREIFIDKPRLNNILYPNYFLLPIKDGWIYNLADKCTRKRTKTDYFGWETVNPTPMDRSNWRRFIDWLGVDPILQVILRRSVSGNTKNGKVYVLVGNKNRGIDCLFTVLQKLFHGMALLLSDSSVFHFKLPERLARDFCSSRLAFIRTWDVFTTPNLSLLANGYYKLNDSIIDSTSKIFCFSERYPSPNKFLEIIEFKTKSETLPVSTFTKEDFQDCLYWILEDGIS